MLFAFPLFLFLHPMQSRGCLPESLLPRMKRLPQPRFSAAQTRISPARLSCSVWWGFCCSEGPAVPQHWLISRTSRQRCLRERVKSESFHISMKSYWILPWILKSRGELLETHCTPPDPISFIPFQERKGQYIWLVPIPTELLCLSQLTFLTLCIESVWGTWWLPGFKSKPSTYQQCLLRHVTLALNCLIH